MTDAQGTDRGAAAAVRQRVGGVLTPTVKWRARDLALGSTGPRRYLTPETDLPGLFDEFDRRGVRYSLLRWFEDLPHVAPGEDVDLLVADDDVPVVESLLRPRPLRWDSQAFDLYSVSGLPGTSFTTGVSYYPPHFAQRLIDESVLSRGRYRVPNALNHFLSLAYHAVYHKGYRSGVPSERRPDRDLGTPDHDYVAVLTEAAVAAGQPVALTLEALDGLLADAGLRPPLDTLERLGPHNEWIADHLLATRPPAETIWAGLAVFVLRERAVAVPGAVEGAVAELEKHGFEIFAVRELTQAERATAARRIRGGNWGRGPWKVSGGDPAVFVIGYDVVPRRLSGGTSGVNTRIQAAKEEARLRLMRDVPAAERYNPIHSSDSPVQALDHLEILDDPGLLPALRGQVEALLEQCRMPFPVIKYLGVDGPSRRSRVALVDHPVHGPSVCKVYRPSAVRYFRRDLRARQELGDLPMTPGLLDSGDNWLVMPFYEDDGRHRLRKLPFTGAYDGAAQLTAEASREIAAFVRELHRRGYFILDLTTMNVHSDPVAGLKVIDLEFVQEYRDQVPLAACYSLRGVPVPARDRYDQPHFVAFTGPGIGNPVFHPAVSGVPGPMLLQRRLPAEDVIRRVTQSAWFIRLALARAPWRARAVALEYGVGRFADRVVRKLVRTATGR